MGHSIEQFVGVLELVVLNVGVDHLIPGGGVLGCWVLIEELPRFSQAVGLDVSVDQAS